MNRTIRYPNVPADWDQRFLYLAATVASFSKDPSTRVGALAVRDRRVLAMGFNGFPSGVVDDPNRLDNREIRLAMTTHAEQNLLSYAARAGVCLAGSTVYVYPLMACSSCTAMLINANISQIVIPDLIEPMRWKESFDLARQMCTEAGVSVHRVLLDGPLGASVSALLPTGSSDDDTEPVDLRLT